MIGVEQILLVNTGVSSIVLLVLLILSNKRNGKPPVENQKITPDMQKIKEQISE